MPSCRQAGHTRRNLKSDASGYCASEIREKRGYNHLQLELLHLPIEVFRDKYVPRGRLELERLLGAHLELIGLFLQPPLEEVHARVEKRLDGVWYIP